MPLRFTVEVLGEEQIDRMFLRITDAAQDMAPLFNQLIKDLRLIETTQFLTEGQHGSGGWEALAQSTIDEKKRMGLMPWIERASGALFESLTSGGAGSIEEVTKDYLRYGTTIPYAGFQQSGTRHMPQRRLVQLTEEERRDLAKQVQKYILTGQI